MAVILTNSARTRNAIFAVGAAICALEFVRAFFTIGLHLPLNFNEGWNAYHAADVASGRPLYPDPAGQFFTNYPPLSFYVIAPIGRLLHDQMLAGRLVSLVSLAAWIALVAAVARRLRCSWTASLFGAAVLAASMFVFSSFYVGVNDPQLLGHAMQLLGVAWLLRGRRTTSSIAIAAVLLAAGVFVKNNLIALPLAAATWLWFTDRNNAWRLMAVGTVAAIAGIALCFAAFGPRFVGHVLSPRAYIPAKAALMSWQWIRRMILPLVVTGWLARRFTRDQDAAFGIVYAAVAIVLGAIFAGGEGVYWNSMFDADCALALVAALAIDRFPASSPLRRLAIPAAYFAVPALVIAMSATVHWLSPRFWFDPRWSEAAAAAQDIEFVRGRSGPALCEDLSMCYWANKPAGVDVFNVRQRSRREWWRVEALARQVEAREFGVVQLEDEGRGLGPLFMDALQRTYHVDHAGQWGTFWVPR